MGSLGLWGFVGHGGSSCGKLGTERGSNMDMVGDESGGGDADERKQEDSQWTQGSGRSARGSSASVWRHKPISCRVGMSSTSRQLSGLRPRRSITTMSYQTCVNDTKSRTTITRAHRRCFNGLPHCLPPAGAYGPFAIPSSANTCPSPPRTPRPPQSLSRPFP